METGRSWHAIAEVNLGAVGCLGNLDPVKKERKQNYQYRCPIKKGKQ